MAYLHTNWKATGLIPSDDLIAWHQYSTDSTGGNVLDFSDNGRHLTQGTTPPALQMNVLNGLPGWYFNGTTTNPLQNADDVTPKHVFVLAAYEDAAFTLNRGILSGLTSGDWLTSETSGNEFFSFGAGYDYKKSGTAYADASMTAPMSGVAELLEMTNTSGVAMDGIQVGQQKNLDANARKHKGWWFEQLLYAEVQTGTNLDRIYYYFNVKWAQHLRGLPFYFPDTSFLPRIITQPIVHNRYDGTEPEWDKITDSWEYEDGRMDFNEVGDTAPRRWEYLYQNVPKVQLPIFDEFWNQARKAYSFHFRDPEGVVWSNVHIDDYARPHDGHKRWRKEVSFKLIGFGSEPVQEDVFAPCPVEDFVGTSGEGSITYTWSAAADDCGATSGEFPLVEDLEDTDEFLIEG